MINVAGKKDRILGSVIGLALGDALGAPYEGGFLERCLWSLIGKKEGKLRWTDDTQMTIDVIESLVENRSINQNDLAHRFAQSYGWSRGYGPGAAKLLKLIRKGQSWKSANLSIYPDGSYGNGGAMRSSIVGLFLVNHPDREIVKAAGSIAEITHAHPLGQDGAALIALSTTLVYHDFDSSEIIDRLLDQIKSNEFQQKLLLTKNWLNEGATFDRELIVTNLGNGISAVESCVTSLYLALLFREKSCLPEADRRGADRSSACPRRGPVRCTR
jgi:poly(ADP-ribose) glycohydrolase ARH3